MNDAEVAFEDTARLIDLLLIFLLSLCADARRFAVADMVFETDLELLLFDSLLIQHLGKINSRLWSLQKNIQQYKIRFLRCYYI